MKLFLDCEFNGFGGELISLALVDENQQSFYEVLECPHPVPWVKDHVIPRLNQPSIPLKQFQSRLQIFLFQYEYLEIIADWPEDFALFSRSLVLSAGKCIRTPPLTMQLWMEDPIETHVASENPHNALADAQALKQSYLKAHGQ
jgi:hypothetical protein